MELCVFEHIDDLLNYIPITVCRGNAEQLLELAQVTDRFHFAAVNAKDETALNRDDLSEPVGGGGQAKWKRRRLAERFVHHVHESREVRAGWFVREWIFCRELQEVVRRTNHDLDLER